MVVHVLTGGYVSEREFLKLNFIMRVAICYRVMVPNDQKITKRKIETTNFIAWNERYVCAVTTGDPVVNTVEGISGEEISGGFWA
jgi:hypothetical protein